MTTLAVRLAPPRSRATARVAFRLGCAAAGALLIAGLAQVAVPLPFTPVPITGQTLGVLLVGAAFGPGLGAATVGLYLAWAVIGLPVLAPNPDGSHDVGLRVLQGGFATAGYLWGFVLAAGLVGWLASRGWDRSFRSSVGAVLLGEVVIFTVGVAWLHRALPGILGGPVAFEDTLAAGLYPFVIGDVVKLLAAAALLPAAWKLLDRFRPED
jgi:biotin transport system substrate-specific component